MALYTYRALDKQGEIIQDKLEGSGTMAVAHELRQQGLLVIDVKEQSVGQKDILEPFKRIKLSDLVVFSRQLATMINAGLPIVRALYVLSEQTENPKLKDVVVVVRKDVEAGSSLSQALEKHPEVFSRLYVEMVKAGEIGGILDGVLLRVADQLETGSGPQTQGQERDDLPRRGVGPCDTGCLFHAHLYSARIRQDVPGPGRDAPAANPNLHGYLRYPDQHIRSARVWWDGARRGYVPAMEEVREGRKVWGRAVLRIPAKIGDVVRKVALARFARTLATLSAAGVPILQAIEITATSSGNWVVEKALLKSRDAIREGIPIYKPLETEPVFPPMVTRMIAVGEETGDIDGMLTKIAEFYESEVDAAVKALTSIIEPLMVVVVGGIVGAIVISMYLPMFEIFNLIE